MELMTIKDVAKKLGVSENWVYSAIYGFTSLLFLTSVWAGTFAFVRMISRSGSRNKSETQSDWVQQDRLPKDREKDATPQG
jgi:hypothetical protein